MMEKIALVVIAYNRVGSLKRLLKSLEEGYYDCEENVPLIISVDKSNTDEVERYADEYTWNFGDKKVVKHQQNMGLKQHILSQGIWLDEYDAIVVLEDDVVVARDFWYYVRKCVNKYQDEDSVAGISLYGYSINYHNYRPFIPLHQGDNDVYFMNCAMSWGQVWMRNAWKRFYEWYQKHLNFVPAPNLPNSICSWGDKSWLRYHTWSCIEENKYFVFPYVSYSTNYSDCGVHQSSADSTIFQVPLLQGMNRNLSLPDLNEAVIYDGFFENKSLFSALNLSSTECCLDLNGANDNREHKRFWLTTKRLPYKVMRHYALKMRPLELNVLKDVNEGTGIYLYDISASEPSSLKINDNQAFLIPYFITNAFLFLREYGYVNVIRDFFSVVKCKLNMIFNKK